MMDLRLLEACTKGDFGLCNHLILADPDFLLSTTPHSNNCLHIAAMLGNQEFAKEVWSRAPFLFSATNLDGETPLITAIMAANCSLASDIITAASQYMRYNDLEEQMSFNQMLLKVDRRGENALHHAMRNNFETLALQLFDMEPLLSKDVIKTGESPMYMAARKGYSKVVEKLLEIPDSSDSGPLNESALVAAVRAREKVTLLLKKRPGLAYKNDSTDNTPLRRAILHDNLDLVKIFLKYDPKLAFVKNKPESTAFMAAAQKGSVSIAEIRIACPDSVYIPNKDGYNALHEAINYRQHHFVDYVLRTPQLHRLINQASNLGSLHLHHAALMCDPKLLRTLLSHEGQDYTAVNIDGCNAVGIVYAHPISFKTLKWNESFSMLLNVIPSGWKYLVKDNYKQKMETEAIKDVKSLIAKYTANTSLVAALLATITFAAAFTLPGGFSADPGDAGLPIFAGKATFQVFIFSDTIAMRSSLVVTFLCILSTWADLDFLLNYRKTTRALMWCAYGATVIAFGTGLFTVMAPHNLWLAIFILVLCIILPFLWYIYYNLQLVACNIHTGLYIILPFILVLYNISVYLLQFTTQNPPEHVFF